MQECGKCHFKLGHCKALCIMIRFGMTWHTACSVGLACMLCTPCNVFFMYYVIQCRLVSIKHKVHRIQTIYFYILSDMQNIIPPLHDWYVCMCTLGLHVTPLYLQNEYHQHKAVEATWCSYGIITINANNLPCMLPCCTEAQLPSASRWKTRSTNRPLLLNDPFASVLYT